MQILTAIARQTVGEKTRRNPPLARWPAFLENTGSGTPSCNSRPLLIITRKHHLVLLAAVTLLAALARFYQALESLWIDELHTAWVAAGDLYDVAPRARIGNQSPPYFYLTWAVSGLLGMNEVSLRLPSLVAGTALVPLVYWLVYGWTTSRGAALLAAVLAAVDRDLIYFAQEARPYALVQLVAVAQILAFWQLTAASTASAKVKGGSWGARQAGLRAVFSLGTALLIGLHYTAALLVAAELAYFIFLAWRRKGTAAYFWYDIAFDLLVAAVFCLPIRTHLTEVFGRRHLWRQFVGVYPTWSMIRLAGIYLGLPLIVLSLVVAIRKIAGRTPSLGRIDGRAAALCVCWLAVPVGLAWVSTYFDLARLFFPRYLIASALALPAGAGIALAMLPNRLSQALFALAVVGASIGSSGMIEQLREDGRLHADRDEDWRGAVAFIAAESDGKPVPVLLAANLIEDELLEDSPSEELVDYCRFPLSGLYRLDRDERRIIPSGSGLSEAEEAAILEAREWWIVTRGKPAVIEAILANAEREDTNQRLAQTLVSMQVESRRSFGNVHVARVRVIPVRQLTGPGTTVLSRVRSERGQRVFGRLLGGVGPILD